jgi:hypothetical protein
MIKENIVSYIMITREQENIEESYMQTWLSNQVLRFRMIGAVYLFLLYAFMVCTGFTLPFICMLFVHYLMKPVCICLLISLNGEMIFQFCVPSSLLGPSASSILGPSALFANTLGLSNTSFYSN